MSSDHSAPSASASRARAQTGPPVPLEAYLLCGGDPEYPPTGSSSDEHARLQFEGCWKYIKHKYTQLLEQSKARMAGQAFKLMPTPNGDAKYILTETLGTRAASVVSWWEDLHFRLLGESPVPWEDDPSVEAPAPTK
jgi:hypothetical protein